MKRVKDLVVKTGSYTKDGQEKSRWQTVGTLMEDDKGGQFLFLNRSFNPAGVPFKEGSESIIVSMFDPKNKDEQQAAPKPSEPEENIPF